MINGLKNGISSVMGTIGGVIQSGFNSAISFLTSLPSKAMQWGADFVHGLASGISSAIGGVVDQVKNVAGQIASFLHFSVPDVGPLTTYEQWMPDFMAGLAQGIDKNKSKVTDAIKGLSTDMSVGLNLNNLNKIPVADNISQGIINSRNISNQNTNNDTNGIENTLKQILQQMQNSKDNPTIHVDKIELPEVNDAEDFVNTVTRWCNTHQNGY